MALLLALSEEDRSVLIESLDDVETVEDDGGRKLLQLKHVDGAASLTDMSPDLWKTIRVWATHWQSGEMDEVEFLLITTATAPVDSIPSLMRDPRRHVSKILAELERAANTSKNEALAPSFKAFLALPSSDRRELVLRMRVVDQAEDILAIEDRLLERIALVVPPEHRHHALHRLEGWWMPVAIEHLRKGSPIRSSSVFAKVRDIGWSFGPSALPIDYRNATPEDEIDAAQDDRPFVLQLKAISVNLKRIERAILDYYRAYEQRARWVREDLIIEQDLGEYESRLVDEWERMRLTMADEIPRDATDAQLEAAGKAILKWMEWTADVRIRPDVAEGFLMRGSYHILANRGPGARIWWHPDFPNRVADILGITLDDANA